MKHKILRKRFVDLLIQDSWKTCDELVTRYACQCKNGYVGNGFSCVKDSSDYDDLVDIVDLM